MKRTFFFKSLLLAAMLAVGASAWAQITTWTFKDNTSVWGADGVTLKGGNQYDNDAKSVTSGGVTFTGTNGFVSTAKGIGFNAVGSTSDENISIVVPAGYKATVSVYSNTNRKVVAKFGEETQEYASSWGSATKEFDNSTGDTDVTLYLYNDANPGGSAQNKAPFLEAIVLTDMTSVASYSWTANAVAMIDDVKTTIKTYSSTSDVAEGANYNVVVDKIIIKDGVYYELNDAAFAKNVFGKTYTMGNSAPVHEITYTKVENAVFFGEIEDIYTAGSNASMSASTVLSNGNGYSAMSSKGGYVKVTFNVPSDGIYNLALGMNNTNSSDRGFNYSIDGAGESETFTVTKSSAYVQSINNEYLAKGEHTLQMNITYSLTPVFDYLLITKSVEAENAIADCKVYETSSDFATFIDTKFAAGELLTAAQVYAAHTAWQIENASDNDLTKVIFNADFSTGSIAHWTIYGDAAAGDTDANSNGTIESNGDGGYQYYTGWNGRNVSQNIYGLPAGVYRLTARIYSWSGGAPVKLFANGTLSAEENGENHEPSLEFTVSGSEESVKVGVGGVGQGSGDNTWGTWGYRVNYFTLTRVTVPATVTSVGYATFCNADYNLDFSSASDIEACKATVDEDGKITYTVVNTVAAGEGVLLRTKSGNAATESIPVIASATTNEGNAFVGIPEKVKLAQSTEDGYTNYILSKVDDVLGFYKVNTNGSWCNAGTAYLKVANTVSPARGFFALWGDEITGINAATEKKTVEGQAYNLNGQRVAQPAKGLYIVNGKKVIIK